MLFHMFIILLSTENSISGQPINILFNIQIQHSRCFFYLMKIANRLFHKQKIYTTNYCYLLKIANFKTYKELNFVYFCISLNFTCNLYCYLLKIAYLVNIFYTWLNCTHSQCTLYSHNPTHLIQPGLCLPPQKTPLIYHKNCPNSPFSNNKYESHQ